MSPPPRRFTRHICSSAEPDPAPAPAAVTDAASRAAAAVLRAPRFESRLLSLIPRALLFDPSCIRLTLSRLLPSQAPALRFLLFLSSHLPAPDEAPAPSPQLPAVDTFLLSLSPPLAADAAALLASYLGLHPSLPALNAASRAALSAARPDLVFRLFSTFSSSPAFPGDAETVACLVRACAADCRQTTAAAQLPISLLSGRLWPLHRSQTTAAAQLPISLQQQFPNTSKQRN